MRSARAAELGDRAWRKLLPEPTRGELGERVLAQLRGDHGDRHTAVAQVCEEQRMPGTLAPVRRLGEAFRGVVDGHTIVDYMRQLLIALAWLALAIALAARAYRFNMSTGHYPGDFADGICAG